MNELIQDYKNKSNPIYCTEQGFVDEIVKLTKLRHYITAFVYSAYQNPRSICAFHQMLLPRAIRDYYNISG